MTQPSVDDDLVRVASYVNVAQAELAWRGWRWTALRPAWATPCCSGAGISATPPAGSACLWPNGTPIGAGDPLCRGTPPQSQPPPWACPKCGAEADGTWQVCWACGTAKDGTEDPAFFDEPECTSGLDLVPVEHFVGLLTGTFLALFLLMEREPAVVAAWLATMVCLGLRQVGRADTYGTDWDPHGKQNRRPTTHRTWRRTPNLISTAGALRAWQASVYGTDQRAAAGDLRALALGMHRVWPKNSASPGQPAARVGPWVFGVLALPFGLGYLFVLFVVPIDLLSQTAAQLFNVSGMTARPP